MGFLVALVVKNLPANAGEIRDAVWSLGWEDPLEESTATHSSLAWRIPWTEEHGRLQSIGLQRVEHNWGSLAFSTEISLLLFLFSKWNIVDLKCCASLWCKAKWLGYTHMYILFYIIFYYGLLWDTDYGSLCFMLGSCYLSILYITVCIYQPQTFSPSLFISSPHW